VTLTVECIIVCSMSRHIMRTLKLAAVQEGYVRTFSSLYSSAEYSIVVRISRTIKNTLDQRSCIQTYCSIALHDMPGHSIMCTYVNEHMCALCSILKY
jgi:hypothetical protein